MRHSLFCAALLALGVATSTGCYHATIVSGATPSTEVIDQKWAHSFLWGIVPPATVEAAAKCPNGLAKVETQHSFLNGLVAILTFGIYTPVRITVTCAAKGAALGEGVPTVVGVAGADAADVVTEAAQMAVLLKGPVLVQFPE